MRRALMSVMAVVAAVLTVPTAGSAFATEPVISPDGNYCAFNIDTDAIACVEDLADLDLARDSILNSPYVGRFGMAAASVNLGRFYDNANFDASAGLLDLWGSAPCTAALSPRDSGWSPMGGWANRVSSFKGNNGCFIRLWSGVSYTGSNLSYRVTSSYVGAAMNDNAESVEFS